MAKIVPSHLVSSISGKLCKKDTTYIGVNKRTGKMYSAGYHGCVQPNCEKQQVAKADFTKKAQFASAWWKQNRPSATSAKGTEAYLAVMKADWRKKALTFPTVGARLAVGFLFFGQEYHTDTNLCTTMRTEGGGVGSRLCILLCIFFFLLFLFVE